MFLKADILKFEQITIDVNKKIIINNCGVNVPIDIKSKNNIPIIIKVVHIRKIIQMFFHFVLAIFIHHFDISKNKNYFSNRMTLIFRCMFIS